MRIDDVPTLLSTDRVVAGVERLEHRTVADGGRDDVDAGGAHRLVETEVAHDRDDHRVVR